MLTERETEVLKWIKAFRQDLGYSPSLAEIGDGFGITKSGARAHVDMLVEKGALTRKPGVGRSLVPAKAK